MKTLLSKMTALYLSLRVKNADQLGTMDIDTGKVSF